MPRGLPRGYLLWLKNIMAREEKLRRPSLSD
jgi:hypothetical protein